MNLLFKNIVNSFKWSLSIGSKFVRVVPVHTLAIVISTLISQFAMLIASLLPLKIIILLGSPGIPRYFPRSFIDFDREQLVIWLSIIAVASYLFYLVLEKLIVYWSEQGSKILLQKNKKIILFQNQEEVATSSYQRYARCLAGAVFVGLAIVIIGIIYTELAVIILGYSLVIFILFNLLYSISQHFRERIEEDLGNILSMIGTIGFLVSFIFMVANFLFGSPPGLLVAIVSIILIRQTVSRFISTTKDFVALNSKRFKINALFFYGHTLINDKFFNDSDFWSLLEHECRKTWIRKLLSKITGIEIAKIKAVWFQTRVTDVVAFDVQSLNFTETRYYIKLFNTKRRGQAIHEANLFAAFRNNDLPAPRFLGIDHVERYNCIVFEINNGEKPLTREVKNGECILLKELWSITPPNDIVNRYRRSQPLLAHRINDEMSERLQIVANEPCTVANVKSFAQVLNLIRVILMDLPLCIYNPDLNKDTMIKLENENFMAVHWGRWSLEPVGAGWPTRGKSWKRLPKYLENAKVKRQALSKVSIDEVRLAALMFAFEGFYNRQRYISALELLPNILECVKAIQQSGVLYDKNKV